MNLLGVEVSRAARRGWPRLALPLRRAPALAGAGPLPRRLPRPPPAPRASRRPRTCACPRDVAVEEISGSETLLHADAGRRLARGAGARASTGTRARRAGWSCFVDPRAALRLRRAGGARSSRRSARCGQEARMARIELARHRAHLRAAPARADEDYALKPLEPRLGRRRRLCAARALRLREDDAAQHHLRPGYARREGACSFDGVDVTARRREERNIAQVFQFPVIYDTMTVPRTWPSRCATAAWPSARREARVGEIAELLELTRRLERAASGLSADMQAEDLARARPGAQGRRRDPVRRAAHRHRSAREVAAAPQAQADPPAARRSRWSTSRTIRSRRSRFADEVVVMNEGRGGAGGHAAGAVRAAGAHLRRLLHRQPGMNLLPCAMTATRAVVEGQRDRPAPRRAALAKAATASCGSASAPSSCALPRRRPRRACGSRSRRSRPRGLLDRHGASSAAGGRRCGCRKSSPRRPAEPLPEVPTQWTTLFVGAHTCLSRDADREGRAMDKPSQPEAWLLVLPVLWSSRSAPSSR